MILNSLIILGIDPGTTSIGYAVVEKKGGNPRLLQAGLFNIKSAREKKHLEETHRDIEKIIKEWRPEILAMEKLFFAKNTKTALAVAETRGALMLTTALAGLTLFEYTPLEVKKTITGDGRADKTQVKKMLSLTIEGVRDIKARDDVYDAIAIALTHCFKEKYNKFTEFV